MGEVKDSGGLIRPAAIGSKPASSSSKGFDVMKPTEALSVQWLQEQAQKHGTTVGAFIGGLRQNGYAAEFKPVGKCWWVFVSKDGRTHWAFVKHGASEFATTFKKWKALAQCYHAVSGMLMAADQNCEGR
jgi:hypothetical protein